MPTEGGPVVIPKPGSCPDVKADALAAFNVLKAGGVVILPTDIGYGIASCSAEGIERAFAAKKRRPGHTLGIIASYDTHTTLHDLPPRAFDMTRVITQELGTVLVVVGPLRMDHPRVKQLSPLTLERAVKNGTAAIAIPEGPLSVELGRLNDEDGQLMIGSSANMTGQGQKFRVEDIEPEVLECADLIVDYGPQKYHTYGRSGTILDMENLRCIRIGAAYEIIRARLKKWWGVELPDEDPDYKDADPWGVGVSIKLVADT